MKFLTFLRMKRMRKIRRRVELCCVLRIAGSSLLNMWCGLKRWSDTGLRFGLRRADVVCASYGKDLWCFWAFELGCIASLKWIVCWALWLGCSVGGAPCISCGNDPCRWFGPTVLMVCLKLEVPMGVWMHYWDEACLSLDCVCLLSFHQDALRIWGSTRTVKILGVRALLR